MMIFTVLAMVVIAWTFYREGYKRGKGHGFIEGRFPRSTQ